MITRLFVSILLLNFLPVWPVFGQVIKPSIFKIPTKNGVSYVFGTIHGGVSLTEFPFDIAALVKKSRSVLAELDFSTQEIEAYMSDPYSVIVNHSPFHGGQTVDPTTLKNLMALG